MTALRNAPTPSASATNQTPAAAAASMLEFAHGAVPHTEQIFDISNNLGASAVPIQPQDIPAIGFLRSIVLRVDISSTGNAATVTLNADAPWSVFAEIAITDTSSNPFIGPLLGYNAYVMHKWGGYRRQLDPKLYPDYTALTTGAGATAGSGVFQLRIPVEIIARNGFGSLYNGNSATPYRIRMTLAPLLSVYGVAPNGTVVCRVRGWIEAWFTPDAVDGFGRPQAQVPPGNGTTQFWTQIISASLATGLNTFPIKKVGLSLRNLIFVFRDATPARQQSLVPLDISLYLDTRPIFTAATTPLRLAQAEQNDLISATGEAAGGLDNGVVPWQLCADFDGHAGFETINQYLLTSQGSRLELQITTTGATVLTVLVNDVSPAQGVML